VRENCSSISFLFLLKFQILICRRFRRNQSGKSFRPPFSKGGAVEGAEPSSLTAVSESSNRHFFFAKLFSLCLYRQRKKRQKPLCEQPIEALLGKNNLDAFFDTRGAKKALQRNAVFVGRRPTPRKPLKRLDPNFAALVSA
jgi:hypothetical protein